MLSDLLTLAEELREQMDYIDNDPSPESEGGTTVPYFVREAADKLIEAIIAQALV